MNISWIDISIKQWQEEGVSLNHPATSEIIEYAENAIGIIFPTDFKQLYLKVNGFTNYDWRPNMISLWSIERITQEYEEAIDKLFVSFADFLISSHFIGFSKSVAGVFKHYDQNAPIAYSFEEAIHLINTDSRLIY